MMFHNAEKTETHHGNAPQISFVARTTMPKSLKLKGCGIWLCFSSSQTCVYCFTCRLMCKSSKRSMTLKRLGTTVLRNNRLFQVTMPCTSTACVKPHRLQGRFRLNTKLSPTIKDNLLQTFEESLNRTFKLEKLQKPARTF